MKSQPNNPYFWELKGQVLLEFGQAREAISALRRASGGVPDSGLIRGLLGRALVAAGDPALLDEGIRELTNASQREPDDVENWRQLAIAYNQKDNIGMAEFSAAQEALLMGDMQSAVNHAAKAKAKLPAGSPAALKADDILNSRKPKSN